MVAPCFKIKYGVGELVAASCAKIILLSVPFLPFFCPQSLFSNNLSLSSAPHPPPNLQYSLQYSKSYLYFLSCHLAFSSSLAMPATTDDAQATSSHMMKTTKRGRPFLKVLATSIFTLPITHLFSFRTPWTFSRL